MVAASNYSVGNAQAASVYCGDLDVALPNYKGILSDGMRYLFIDNSALEEKHAELDSFFLQLGWIYVLSRAT
ncbi:hypothetical protein [Burkholderia sp. BCC1999]|uniref:hypothetical protein n=1 Tax=Burkholderia sp. BCC1999 TaxID=2817448 RepID=UPI002AC358B7|nr:hypothetical protein [Burkholderia sp. BCC1999]